VCRVYCCTCKQRGFSGHSKACGMRGGKMAVYLFSRGAGGHGSGGDGGAGGMVGGKEGMCVCVVEESQRDCVCVGMGWDGMG